MNLVECRIYGKVIESPDVSIIIPLYKSSNDIKDQIRSWTSSNLKVEIIYVDDNCPQSSKTTVMKIWKEITDKQNLYARLILLNKNHGFGKACNIGAFQAKGKYLIFLNADTLVTENWIDKIIEPFQDASVGIVGNLQIKIGGQWDGTIDGAGSEWCWSSMQFEHIGRHSYKNELIKSPFNIQSAPKDILELKEVEMVTGCCFAIPKFLFDSLGGFNINYKLAYWEDSELCMAVRDKGYKIIFTPNSRIYHKLSQSGSACHPYHTWNKYYFNNKWIRTKRLDNFVKSKRPEQDIEIKNILVKRLGANGDVLLSSGVLFALKQKYPDSKISFLTECKEILKDNNYIDEFPNIDDVLNKDYDLFLNFDLEYERRPKTNILESICDLAGIKIEDYYLYIKTKDIKVPNNYIVLHPGRTNWVGRDWHEDKFNEIAIELKKQGHTIVCTGTKNNRGVSCDLDLRGKTTLQELAYVISKSKLFVGIDSLALHIAQAFNISGVCFFGSINPEYRLFRNNMYPVVAENLNCLGCHHRQLPPATTLQICETKNLDCENLVTTEMFMEKINYALRLS